MARTHKIRPAHKWAGQTVIVKLKGQDPDGLNGKEFRVEDWWINVMGKSWMECRGNAACMIYGIRSGFAGLPTDDEVVYGKIGIFGHLLHVSELDNIH